MPGLDQKSLRSGRFQHRRESWKGRRCRNPRPHSLAHRPTVGRRHELHDDGGGSPRSPAEFGGELGEVAKGGRGEMIEKRNFAELFSKVEDHWNPRIAAELNGQYVKLVKFQGDFVWHSHENEDEMFYVLDGSFRMELRDKNIELGPGDFIVIPRGV